MKPWFLLVLLPLASAQLSINVDVDPRPDLVTVQLTGEDNQVISDDEITDFGLYDSAIKEACYKRHEDDKVTIQSGLISDPSECTITIIYASGRPTDVYLRSPTPWGDLYQRYGWTQVHRKLKPIKATVLNVKSEPTVIATQKFKNTASKPAKYTADIKQEVSNTITDSWTSSDSVSAKQEVNYKFTIPVGELGGKTSLSYSHKWGKGESTSKKVKVGVKSGVTATVEPGDTAFAVLTASRGKLEIEVDYEVSLYGSLAINYENGHNGHYFWSYDVNAVMGAANIPPTRRVTQIIEVGFYADADISVNDNYQE